MFRSFVKQEETPVRQSEIFGYKVKRRKNTRSIFKLLVLKIIEKLEEFKNMFKQVKETTTTIINRNDYQKFQRITKNVQSDLTLAQFMIKVKNYRNIYEVVNYQVKSEKDFNKTFSFEEALELTSEYIKELTICEFLETNKIDDSEETETSEEDKKTASVIIKKKEVVLIVRI